MAGIDMSESEMHQQWKMAEMTIPGPESLRQTQIEVLREGIRVFSEVAEKFGPSECTSITSHDKQLKKWWQFWK